MPIPDLLAGVFGTLPEDLRSQVTTALDAPEAAPVVAELVNGFKRQSDYSRSMDEARAAQEKADALYQSNVRWFAENEAALAAAKAAGTPKPVVTPVSQTFSRDDVNAMIKAELDAFGADALGVVAATNDLALRHYQEFGERLDLPKLIKDAGAQHIPLTAAYETMFADRYQAKADKAVADARAKLIAETESRVRAEFASTPYPVRPSMGPDTLSGLVADATKTNDFTVAAAAAEYEAKRMAREALG